jgi:hypothetical protein
MKECPHHGTDVQLISNLVTCMCKIVLLFLIADDPIKGSRTKPTSW